MFFNYILRLVYDFTVVFFMVTFYNKRKLPTNNQNLEGPFYENNSFYANSLV